MGQTPGQMQRYTTEETWALEMEIGGSEVKGCRQLKRVRGQPGFHETHSERERGVGTKQINSPFLLELVFKGRQYRKYLTDKA